MIESNGSKSTTVTIWDSDYKSSYSWRLKNRTCISWGWNFCNWVKTQQKEEKAGIEIKNRRGEEGWEEKSPN